MHSRSSQRLLAAALLAAVAATARAEEPSETEPQTPRAAAAAALRANADLGAVYAAIEAARGRLVQAGLWPNPELSLTGASDFAFQNEGERRFGGGFAQRFPIAGRLARARDVARVDVAAALAEASDFERTLIGEVQRAALRILALDRAIAAWDDVIAPAGELMRVSQQRFEAAEASEADVNLLAIEVARFEQEKRLVELERRGEAIRLNQFVGRAAEVPVVVAGSIEDPLFDDADVAQIGEGASARRGDLAAARLGADRARAEATLARAQAWEDWSFGIGVDSDRQVFAKEPSIDPIGAKRDEFLGFGLTVPIPLWNRNQGRIAEARADERRAVARRTAIERAVEAEVATARARVVELSRIAREYRDALLPRARRNVALLDRGYAQGLAPASSLVQAQQQLADAALRYARSLGELRAAEVDLETAAAASPLLARTPMKEAQP